MLWLVLAGVIVVMPVRGQEGTPPLPHRNPARITEPATETAMPAPVPKPDLPDDEPALPWQSPKVNAALTACAKLLEGVTIDYEQLPPIKRGPCGAPAPILVKSIGKDPAVVIEPPATVTCTLAAVLDTWLKEKVQPAAMAFGSPVVKIRNASSYKCRNRYAGANTRISEHALANALDVSEFVLGSGERVTVLDNWRRPPPSPEPPPLPVSKPARDAAVTGSTPPAPITKAKAIATAPPVPAPVAKPPVPSLAERKSAFLRTIHADGCKTFETVLGPETNEAHKDHFHLDMKKRRYVKICE